jgi:hypothetical protein
LRKISQDDAKSIVKILRSWRSSRLTWDALRTEISSTLLEGAVAWSRQSLQANEDVNAAWLACKDRLSARSGSRPAASEDPDTEVTRLQMELAELQTKYDNLLLRHRVVINNASLLPGGTQLLTASLPDNTRSQTLPRGRLPRRVK